MWPINGLPPDLYEETGKISKETKNNHRGNMKKRRKNTYRKILLDKCIKLHSLYTRLKYADKDGMVSCITCGSTRHFKEMDSGHYKHGVLDFDEINRHPQCTYCNRYLSGNLGEYARHIISRYGLEKFEDLHIRASMAKKGNKYEIEYLEKLAIELTFEISNIVKEKNIILSSF